MFALFQKKRLPLKYLVTRLSILWLMQVRTDAYRQAILENPSLIKGAVVMDVGCGTGILRLGEILLIFTLSHYIILLV